MREMEVDALAMPWENARAPHLLAIRRMVPVEVGDTHEKGYDANQDGFMMYTQKVETLEPFSSHVIPMKTTEEYLGEWLNVMVQALYIQDSTLPPGLTMQNTYTELEEDSSGKGNTCTTTTRNSPNLRVYQFQKKCVQTLKLQS